MVGAKAEPEGTSSPWDLEYKAHEDDAWYIVHVALDANAGNLTVKYWCTPKEHEAVFSAADFTTEAQVDELAGRFRPVSKQVKHHQCGMLSIGTTVCAAGNDFRFYDAVIEAVKREAHSFVDGEEVCLCKFVLVWQHGPNRATLTSANIATISIPQSATQLHPTFSAFAIMAKNKITSSHFVSTNTKPTVICLSDSDSETNSQNASLNNRRSTSVQMNGRLVINVRSGSSKPSPPIPLPPRRLCRRSSSVAAAPPLSPAPPPPLLIGGSSRGGKSFAKRLGNRLRFRGNRQSSQTTTPTKPIPVVATSLPTTGPTRETTSSTIPSPTSSTPLYMSFDEDEHIDDDYENHAPMSERLYIYTYHKVLMPSNAVSRLIRNIMSRRMELGAYRFKLISQERLNEYWETFQRETFWDPGLIPTPFIYELFVRRARDRYPDLLYYWKTIFRVEGKRPPWDANVWNALQEYWKRPEVIAKSLQCSKNRKSVPGGRGGMSKHKGGSKGAAEWAETFEKTHKRPPNEWDTVHHFHGEGGGYDYGHMGDICSQVKKKYDEMTQNPGDDLEQQPSNLSQFYVETVGKKHGKIKGLGQLGRVRHVVSGLGGSSRRTCVGGYSQIDSERVLKAEENVKKMQQEMEEQEKRHNDELARVRHEMELQKASQQLWQTQMSQWFSGLQGSLPSGLPTPNVFPAPSGFPAPGGFGGPALGGYDGPIPGDDFPLPGYPPNSGIQHPPRGNYTHSGSGS